MLWDRGLSNYAEHSVPYHGPLLCSRFLSHMKGRPEDFRPPYFPSSKSKPLPPCQTEQKLYKPAFTAPKIQTLDGNISLSTNRRKRCVFLQDSVTGHANSAVAPRLPLHPTPLPNIKPSPCSMNSPEPHQELNALVTSPCLQSHPMPEDIVYEAPLLSPLPLLSTTNTKLCQSPAVQEPPRTPILSHGSLSDISRPPSSLFSHSVDLTSERSSVLSHRTSAESWSSSPEGIICSPLVHSSSGLQTPVAPCLASLPRHSPANLSTTSSLISTKLKSQTEAPSLHHISSSAICEPQSGGANIVKSPNREIQTGQMTASGQNFSVPASLWASCHPSPNADSLKQTLSPPVSCAGYQWPVLPPISSFRDGCNTAASCSSEVSCSQSHVFDELDAIAPLSVSCSSLDQRSESSHSPSKNTDVSSGLAALTVGCDSGNLGSLSRVQLLLLNRQEYDAVPSPFSFDDDEEEDLLLTDNYCDNGVWRPLTAGSISEKCGSTGKDHKNKLGADDACSASPCSWIIDPSPSYDMLKSADSPCSSSLGSTEGEGLLFEEQPNYPRFNEEKREKGSTMTRREEERDRKMEEKKTKVLKILSKLQDDAPQQPTSIKGRSNFEDFDFLAKYCIFNQEKLAEYKRAFEEEDSDGDGYISCLQLLLALKNIIPAELLSEEEEIYVYKILEMVDFRVSEGLVDLRLFAVIASLAQKIATMDEFMRSLISSTDFRSLEVRLFKAKKLFLYLLEEQAGEGTSQQKFISPEQLLLELKAGGICLEQEAAISLELQRIPPLDLLDFLAYLPLFMSVHKSIIANPLDDSIKSV